MISFTVSQKSRNFNYFQIRLCNIERHVESAGVSLGGGRWGGLLKPSSACLKENILTLKDKWNLKLFMFMHFICIYNTNLLHEQYCLFFYLILLP